MKINNMKSGDDPHPKGELQVREQADERSVFRWRIAGVEGLKGLHIDR
jgi:hypothetical protein